MNIIYNILLIALILLIIICIFKITNSYRKSKRVLDFTLDKKSNGEYYPLESFSNFLRSLVIFNTISKTYDKYVYEGSHLKDGMDYISLKIILGFILGLGYILSILIMKDNFSTLFIFLIFVIGFVIPDFYCIISYDKKMVISSVSLLRSFMTIRDGLQVDKSMEKVLKEVIDKNQGYLKREYQQVLADYRLGLTIGEAFLRMYGRTHLKIFKDLSSRLEAASHNGISYVNVFKDIIDEFNHYEVIEKKVTSILVKNTLLYILLVILPLILVITILLFNSEYKLLLFGSSGTSIILTEGILYFVYIIILSRLLRGRMLWD